MKVTEVKVYPTKGKDSKIKAFASITLDKVICITGIRIINGSNGLFIAFPQQKGSDEEYHDIVFPITKEGREGLSKKILDAYKKQDQSEADDETPFS